MHQLALLLVASNLTGSQTVSPFAAETFESLQKVTPSEAKTRFGKVYQEETDYSVGLGTKADLYHLLPGSKESIGAIFKQPEVAQLTFQDGEKLNTSSLLTLVWKRGSVSQIIYRPYKPTMGLEAEMSRFGPIGAKTRLKNYTDPTFKITPSDPKYADWLFSYGEQKVSGRYQLYAGNLKSGPVAVSDPIFRFRFVRDQCRTLTYFLPDGSAMNWKAHLGIENVRFEEINPKKPNANTKKFKLKEKWFEIDFPHLSDRSDRFVSIHLL